jgi:DNA polymerase III subunit beta
LYLNLPRTPCSNPCKQWPGWWNASTRLPILSNVLLEVVGGRVAFIATDLELQISTWMEDQEAADAAFTVSARKLLDISRSLQDVENISLDLNNDQLKVNPVAAASICRPAGARFSQASDSGRPGTQLQPAARFAEATVVARAIRHGGAGHSLLPERHVVLGAGQALDRGGHRWSSAGGGRHRYGRKSSRALMSSCRARPCLELGKLLSDSDDPVHIQVNQNQVVFSVRISNCAARWSMANSLIGSASFRSGTTRVLPFSASVCRNR